LTTRLAENAKAVKVTDALKKGAKVLTDGKRVSQGGAFFEPTALSDVTTDIKHGIGRAAAHYRQRWRRGKRPFGYPRLA
jgi:hypothetical protein